MYFAFFCEACAAAPGPAGRRAPLPRPRRPRARRPAGLGNAVPGVGPVGRAGTSGLACSVGGSNEGAL
eukprot:2464111-Prorocentrum_lima.AAC.1